MYYVSTGVMVAVYALLWLSVIPRLLDTFRELNIPVEAIERRLVYLSAIAIALLLLVNFILINELNRLEKEKKEILKYLEMYSQGQEKLQAIEKKAEFYFSILWPIYLILIGFSVGLFAFTLISPMYGMLGSF